MCCVTKLFSNTFVCLQFLSDSSNKMAKERFFGRYYVSSLMINFNEWCIQLSRGRNWVSPCWFLLKQNFRTWVALECWAGFSDSRVFRRIWVCTNKLSVFRVCKGFMGSIGFMLITLWNLGVMSDTYPSVFFAAQDIWGLWCHHWLHCIV